MYSTQLDKVQVKIAKLEKLKAKAAKLKHEIASALALTAPLDHRVSAPEIANIPSGSRARNIWPKSPEWDKATFQVLEVTGKINQYYAPGIWFKTNEWELAKQHLETNLTKGNIWISEAWIQDGELFTGSRKRVATK
jgi:hypothetical protein